MLLLHLRSLRSSSVRGRFRIGVSFCGQGLQIRYDVVGLNPGQHLFDQFRSPGVDFHSIEKGDPRQRNEQPSQFSKFVGLGR